MTRPTSSPTSPSPATTPTARSTRASPANGKQTTDFGAAVGSATGWRSRRTARSSRSAAAATAVTSPSPATTPTARSTRASPATASRRPTSGATTARPGWRSRRTARSSRSGSAPAAPRDDFALARYNPNGSLDTSFSGDGKQTTDFGFGADDGATAVALQGDGKIVAVGRAGGRATGNDFALARYNPNGSLDTSFSGDGKQTTDFGAGSDDRRPGWRSRATARSSRSAALQRRLAERLRPRPLQPNGSLDTSFSGDGKQTTDFGGSDGANGVAIQGTARSSRSATRRPATGRASPSPATTPTARSTRASPATASRRPSSGQRPRERGGDPGGRQDRRRRPTADQGDFALARYNPNGSLDTSFSGDGKQTTDFGGIYGSPKARPGWRSRATARSSRSAWTPAPTRLRARPLQPERLARHELLWRRQADDRLRGQ